MTNIILSGACGKMGRTLASMIAEKEGLSVCAGIDIQTDAYANFPIVKNPREIPVKGDVIIDFSRPEALLPLLPYAAEQKIPIVVCTTGLGVEHKSLLDEVAKEIPVFFSANMSLGVNLMIALVKKAAAVLADGFDIEIIEKHHNRKVDAPSGTAITIADAIADTLPYRGEYVYDRHSVRRPRGKQEIGIHAVRGGTIVGEHDVIFAGEDEIIEIKHTAMSRDIFAAGAIRAASFLLDKPAGMYCMQDMIQD